MAVHDINNWQRFPYAKKPYAESTLRNKTKTELIQIIRDYEHNYETLWQANERGIKAALEMLPKTGHWISTKDADKLRCSNCDVIHMIAQYPHGAINYCPNCGAEMET